MSPSEKIMHKLSRFVKRQKPQPSSIAAGSVYANPTYTSPASATLSSPSTNATASSSVSATSSSATAGSIPQPSQLPATTNGSQKYVIAHHMVGNTFPYTLDDWTDDITLAHASGIDGFALNMGSDSWEPARVADA
jgi:glucan endo-1,3-alpha-glucosidase